MTIKELDIKIETKEKEVSEKISFFEGQLKILDAKKKTNGFFDAEGNASFNIFISIKKPEHIFSFTANLVQQKHIFDLTILNIGDNLPEHLKKFYISRVKGEPVSFEDVISDLNVALELIEVNRKINALKSSLTSLSKHYSDDKKKDIEINQLFDEINKI